MGCTFSNYTFVTVSTHDIHDLKLAKKVDFIDETFDKDESRNTEIINCPPSFPSRRALLDISSDVFKKYSNEDILDSIKVKKRDLLRISEKFAYTDLLPSFTSTDDFESISTKQTELSQSPVRSPKFNFRSSPHSFESISTNTLSSPSSSFTSPTATGRTTPSRSITSVNFDSLVNSINTSPDIMMGFLNIQETNKILYKKSFVVLASGKLYVFDKQMTRRPLRPPYGETLMFSVLLEDYTLFTCTKNNIYLMKKLKDQMSPNNTNSHRLQDVDDTMATADDEEEKAVATSCLFDQNEIVFECLDSNITNTTVDEWLDSFTRHVFHSMKSSSPTSVDGGAIC